MIEILLERCRQALAPLRHWEGQCHGASLSLVRDKDVLEALGVRPPDVRVQRGFAEGIRSQHSWVTVGDPLKPELTIDPTWDLWHNSPQPDVRIYDGRPDTHIPHKAGSIWDYGKPPTAKESGDDPIHLGGLTQRAEQFIRMCGGPLGRRGWNVLAHAPVEGWPAADIWTAMNRDPRLSPLIPIDSLGNWTDVNPEGLYW